MGRRKAYTREFKESAIELYNSSGKSAKEIADGLGFHPENLSRWLRESAESKGMNNIKVFPGQGNPRDEEMARLKKENADLRETVEILKKATAVLVKKPQ